MSRKQTDRGGQPPTFARALSDLMTTRQMSQAEVARQLGEYQGNISRWLAGGGITIRNVFAIADLFEVDRAYLARLAGFPVERTDSDIDPEMAALLDAERSEAHRELRDIPPIYWRAIIDAGVAARRQTAQVARLVVSSDIPQKPAGVSTSKSRREKVAAGSQQ